MALSNRYENETKDAILQRLLDRISDDIDKRQGSVAYDLSSPAAIELAQAYIELDNVLTFGFASEDTPSEYLDKRCAELGVYRRPSVKAEGSVVFNGPDGTFIAEGTQVYTDEENAIYFETIADVTIINGSATAQVRAIEGGTRGNVGANRITLVAGDLSSVVTVNNPQAFEGGVDTESDESLLERYYDRARKPATSGNVYHYERWAKEVAGVGDVKVYPLWNGNGTVRIVIIDDNKRKPSQSIIDNTAQYIESVRPIGADVTVEGAEEVPINVSATLTLADGADINEVTTQIIEGITEYLATLAFNDTLVRYTRIAAILLDIPRIIDYTELTVNGGMTNIEVLDDQIAVLGEVNFVESQY